MYLYICKIYINKKHVICIYKYETYDMYGICIHIYVIYICIQYIYVDIERTNMTNNNNNNNSD